jgi:hypothetical protein
MSLASVCLVQVVDELPTRTSLDRSPTNTDREDETAGAWAARPGLRGRTPLVLEDAAATCCTGCSR